MRTSLAVKFPLTGKFTGDGIAYFLGAQKALRSVTGTEAGDAEVLPVFASIQKALQAHCPELSERLANAIRSYDFDYALELMRSEDSLCALDCQTR